MTSEYPIINNEKNLHFELKIENEEPAYIEYRWYKSDLALMHTFVPKTLEGKGVASSLAKFALEYAKEKKLQIMVYFPFVGQYLTKHPEYSFLVDKKYHQ